MIAVEYMRLPASQYSVLDAERIERVSEDTFRCYVYTIKFFSFEVCPVLLVKVEEQPNGCCIKLLSCKVVFYCSIQFTFFFYFRCSSDFFCLIWWQLEGSPMVAAQNDKFDGENSLQYIMVCLDWLILTYIVT